MNKEQFTKSIEDIHVPVEKLMARERTAMLQARKKKAAGRIVKRSVLVACGLCFSLLASGFVSNGAAKALSKVPIIGPIYEQFGEIASDKIQRDDLAAAIDKQSSHNGLTMTVKDAVYDGGRLIVTVEYEGEKSLSLEEGKVGYTNIMINGEEFEAAIGTAGQDQINPTTIIEHHQFTLSNYDEFGDDIEVAIQGKDLFGYKGKWAVAFPLEKVEGEIHTFEPDIQAQTTDQIYTLTTEKITFSQLSTRIDLTLEYPNEMDQNDTWPWFDYIVVDDKGNIYDKLKLQVGMAGNFGHEVVLVLPPIDDLPHSLTIKPIDNSVTDDMVNREFIQELELTVPLEQESDS